MFRPFYIAATGMDAFQTDLESIIDNVSNAQTTSFKRSRIEFANLFPKVLEQAVSETETGEIAQEPVQLGSGVKIVGSPRDFSQGNITITNNPLDLAIQGDGFFQFMLPGGNLAYGRAGNLHRDNEGMLVDSVGNILEPQIRLPEETTGIVINQDGTIFVQQNNQANQQEIGQITLVSFANPAGLESIGDNLYTETAASGSSVQGIPGRDNLGELTQYSLESSNVDVVTEMMRMVITQRSFDVISKAVQGGEGMLKSALEIAQG